MQKLKQLYAELRDNEKKFLRDGKRSIAKYNVRTLALMTAAGFVLAVLYLLIGFIVPFTAVTPDTPPYPSPAHLIFLPVLLIFAVAANLYRYKGNNSYRVSFWMSLLYELTVFAFTISIDVFSHPGTPACFMQLIIIVFSATLFFSTRTQNIINILVSAVFIFCTLMVNVEEYMEANARYNIFFMIIGFGFATLLGYHFRINQISNFTSNAHYKSISMLDPMLGNIYNKRGYEDAIDNYLASRNPDVTCALFVLDLNDFKHINDNYGHDMGDQILKCMSDALVSLFRDSDIIGRFGGDEFIVLADGMSDEEFVKDKSKYIASQVGKNAQDTGAIKVFSSVGAVICEHQKVSFERLFELADQAMYEAKERGRKADQFSLRRYTDAESDSAKK